MRVRVADTFISGVATNLIGVFAGYFVFSDPLYINKFNFFIICFLVIILYLLSAIPLNGKLHTIHEFLGKRISLSQAMLVFVIAVLICRLIFPFLFPSFQITEPKEGYSVKLNSAVSGHGAIPGSSVKVYVIDRFGQPWLQGTVGTTMDGQWECNSVNFGQYGSKYVGQNFKIFASLTKDGGYDYKTPVVNVIRS